MIHFMLEYIDVVLEYGAVKFAYGIILATAVYLLAFKLFKGEFYD